MKNFLLLFVLLLGFISSNIVSASSRYPDIESEIFSIQKGIISDIRSLLQIDVKQGRKQAGSMMLSTKIDTDTASGSVRFSVENYSSIFDAKTKNTEVEYRGFVDLEIHGSNYDYESYNEDTYEYKKIPFDLFSTMSFDVKVILSSDGTSYIQVVKLSALSHGDKTIKKNFDESMTSFQKYVGKTYKLPTSLTQGSQLDPEFIQKNILNALNILDQKPLFTVLSKQEDSYSLGLNILTLKSLGWTPYKRGADIIRYVKNQNGGVITIVDKKNPKNNSISLSNDGGKRSLDVKVITTSLKSGKFSMKLHLSKEAIALDLRDKYFSCILDWKDNRFNLGIVNKSKYDDTMPTFSIKVFGDLFMDGSKMDLTIVSNGKSIGALVGKKQGNTGEYSLRLNIAMPFVTFLTNISGNYINEIGDYTVLVPSIYELLDNTINE